MYSSLTCDPGTAYPMNCVRSFAVLFVMFCCCLFCLGCNIVAGQFTWFTFSYLSVTTLTGTRAIVDTYWCSPFDLSFLSTIQWRHNERDCVSNQAHIKENIKDPRHWWVESTGGLLSHKASIIVTSWRLESPASPLFTQPFIRAQIKENIKALHHWPLCWEFIGDRWIPRTNGRNVENGSIWWRHYVTRKMFLFYNVIMIAHFTHEDTNLRIIEIIPVSWPPSWPFSNMTVKEMEMSHWETGQGRVSLVFVDCGVLLWHQTTWDHHVGTIFSIWVYLMAPKTWHYVLDGAAM